MTCVKSIVLNFHKTKRLEKRNNIAMYGREMSYSYFSADKIFKHVAVHCQKKIIKNLRGNFNYSFV